MADALKSPPEGRVTLRNVGWEIYERLAEEDLDRSVPRFFYDRGVLEIVSPSFEHEQIARVTAALVEELSVELDVDVVGAGSTTFKHEELERGFEPDASFYFSEKISRVRGKRRIDLDAGDPTPDLVVEVDQPFRKETPHLRPPGGGRGVALRRRTVGDTRADATGRRGPPLRRDSRERPVCAGQSVR